MVDVVRYEESHRKIWDKAVAAAKNGHFLVNRAYMDYHQQRFIDHSLMFYVNGHLTAILPANLVGDRLCSHGGLTFGGLLFDAKQTVGGIIEIFDALVAYCRDREIERILYKAMPHIYAETPAQEDLYALFRHNAVLVRRDVSSTIDQTNRVAYSKGTKYNISKARKQRLVVTQNQDMTEFWALLGRVLSARHGVIPVHSLEEISSLAAGFPENIALYEAREASGKLLAGAVLYINRHVVHTQYLANSERGRAVGALDFLIGELIERFSERRFFDFGISTEQEGRVLNTGLARHKEGFGARAVVHDFYDIRV